MKHEKPEPLLRSKTGFIYLCGKVTKKYGLTKVCSYPCKHPGPHEWAKG